MSAIDSHDLIRLRHMRDAVEKIEEYTDGCERSDLETDELLALAIVRLLEILGEAAARISPQTQQSLSGIPWRQIVGMRNRLIHGYFDVDLNIVWSVVQDDIPTLSAVLDKTLLPFNPSATE